MVSEMKSDIKKWLGIAKLEQENIRLAKVLILQRTRIEKLEEQIVANVEKSLTSEPAKKKIPVKPKVQNWKSFKSAVERTPQEEIDG